MIDLRSDTVTQPTDGMRAAMAAAEVGDDVFQDDPTVKLLEHTVAELLGKEDSIYVPSGTMSNLIGLRAHTQPGDVVLAAEGAHIDSRELGGANAVAGLTIRQLPGERGTFTAEQVAAAVAKRATSIPGHLMQPVTLVACENTHNAAGGTVWNPEDLESVAAAAGAAGAASHMDGARLWNAVAASGVTAAQFAAPFDSVSVCFSKGLGAPLGSALVGAKQFTDGARRFKQMYGGGFRQAGIVAAAAIYALENHRERLVEDHQNATRLAAGLAELPGIELDAAAVETNMVYFDVTAMPAEAFCVALESHGVAMIGGGRTVRAVTNMGVTAPDIDAALVTIDRVLSR